MQLGPEDPATIKSRKRLANVRQKLAKATDPWQKEKEGAEAELAKAKAAEEAIKKAEEDMQKRSILKLDDIEILEQRETEKQKEIDIARKKIGGVQGSIDLIARQLLDIDADFDGLQHRVERVSVQLRLKPMLKGIAQINCFLFRLRKPLAAPGSCCQMKERNLIHLTPPLLVPWLPWKWKASKG